MPRTKHKTAKKTAKRTVHKKSVRKTHNAHIPDDGGSMPDYRVGSVLGKPGCSREVVIANIMPTYLWPEQNVTVAAMDTGRTAKTTLKELWFLGYTVVREMDKDSVSGLLDGKKVGLRKKVRPGEDKVKPGWCRDGKRVSINNAEILEGENPNLRGVKVAMKRNKVVGLKAVCPECGRVCDVFWRKNRQGYFLQQHKRKENGKAERKVKRTKSVRKSKRTKSRRTR